jgi:hypothetical protein
MSARPASAEEIEQRGDYRAERAARTAAPAVRQLYAAGARRAYEDAAARTEQLPNTPRPA